MSYLLMSFVFYVMCQFVVWCTVFKRIYEV